MKNIISIILVLGFNYVFCQVAFGGKTTVDGSGVLDFSENLNKGIILPWVEDITKIKHSAGTLLFDVNEKKVKWYNGEVWEDLSVTEGAIDTAEIADFPENEIILKSAVILGEPNGAPIGVLSLNAANKALILPKNKEPWLTIKNPEPGTISYDTINDVICIFNGKEWTFWGK